MGRGHTSIIPSKLRFNALICVSTDSRDSPIWPTSAARRCSNSVGWWEVVDASLFVVELEGWEEVDVAILNVLCEGSWCLWWVIG